MEVQLNEERVVLSPLQRIELLCDRGSVHVIRSAVRSHRLGERAADGDGVVGASGQVNKRPLFCFAEDGRFRGGSLGPAHAETIVRVMQLAREARVPVVGFVESAGARMQEGTAALAGFGQVFKANVELSGLVPQISVITGTSAGGGCYSPALTDFVVMARHASMFLTGPEVVRQVTGEDVDIETLGGARVHSDNGVCQLVVGDDFDAVRHVRRLLSYLPQSSGEQAPLAPPREAEAEDPSEVVPQDHFRVYDVRDVARSICDRGSLFELSPRWARNVVTAFARIEGRAIGVVANQPRHLGGVLDTDAAMKAARFVRMCNVFGTPLVVLVDTPGFMPGTRQEQAGVIRHGAKLLHAFAEAQVPKLTVVLRQAYGGGFITMNSKDLGADFAYAWDRARIGIMGARQAVAIINRRELASAEDPDAELERLAAEYAEKHQSTRSAARDGQIDEVIEPAETRARLASALTVLASKAGPQGVTNIQL